MASSPYRSWHLEIVAQRATYWRIHDHSEANGGNGINENQWRKAKAVAAATAAAAWQISIWHHGGKQRIMKINGEKAWHRNRAAYGVWRNNGMAAKVMAGISSSVMASEK